MNILLFSTLVNSSATKQLLIKTEHIYLKKTPELAAISIFVYNMAGV